YRTRMQLRKEEMRERRALAETARAAQEDEAWLRAEALTMLDQGWTVEEMREVGFPEQFLASLLPPRRRADDPGSHAHPRGPGGAHRGLSRQLVEAP
ncbi:MAG TPA: hypothetical protein VHG08_27320, partial [Longimicrobium sp.]|nr:hypothetical protein [Longimicrobium sp.]